LDSDAHAWEQPGDESGDGGVVFDSEMSRLAVDFWRDTDGDVSDFAHGAISPWAFFLPC
jgi:hypothetical protein